MLPDKEFIVGHKCRVLISHLSEACGPCSEHGVGVCAEKLAKGIFKGSGRHSQKANSIPQKADSGTAFVVAWYLWHS